MFHCKMDGKKWEGTVIPLLLRHICLEISGVGESCCSALGWLCVLFIRLLVGVPLSLRDINKILSVNITESSLSHCQQGLRRSILWLVIKN